jgi:hypothetical protein
MDSWKLRQVLMREYRSAVNGQTSEGDEGFPQELYEGLTEMIDENERLRMLIDHYRMVLKDAIR